MLFWTDEIICMALLILRISHRYIIIYNSILFCLSLMYWLSILSAWASLISWLSLISSGANGLYLCIMAHGILGIHYVFVSGLIICKTLYI